MRALRSSSYFSMSFSSSSALVALLTFPRRFLVAFPVSFTPIWSLLVTGHFSFGSTSSSVFEEELCRDLDDGDFLLSFLFSVFVFLRPSLSFSWLNLVSFPPKLSSISALEWEAFLLTSVFLSNFFGLESFSSYFPWFIFFEFFFSFFLSSSSA